MKIGESLQVRSRMEWRRWLARHHREKKEIWLIFYKKSSSRQSITYDDAVEEAICFGWIDGQTRRIDAERYALRLTPRRKKSNWSQSNKARAVKMLRARKMTRAGKDILPADVLDH
jgi:uncharacterized protein YdeI (YjbR/CyaY-like superfamily)